MMAGMNRENFSDYLEEPSKLYQLSYQELKSLVFAASLLCQPARIIASKITVGREY